MRLARAIGVEAPLSHLLRLQPGDSDPVEWIYAVQRFDRRAEANGRVRRLHQVDFLQLRNEWPSTAAKYELSGGARMPLPFDFAAKYASIPAASIKRPLTQRLPHFLVGNSDAHWKNHSLQWHAGKLHAALAPEVGGDNAAFLRQTVIPVIEQRAQRALEAAAGLAPRLAVRRQSRGRGQPLCRASDRQALAPLKRWRGVEDNSAQRTNE